MSDTDPRADPAEALLPAPRRLEVRDGRLACPPEHARALSPTLRSALRPGHAFEAGGVRYAAGIDPGRFDHAEAYRLEVTPDALGLTAASELGLLHAGRTLRQLLEAAGRDASGRALLPALVIEDHPDFAHRGVMLDISRDRVPTPANLRALIDRLAAWKLNELQLYMEHTFAYVGHESVWADASPLSPDEVRALDAYCHDRGIELVPNQNSFGHFERWLKHDAYRPLAETRGAWRTPWGETRDWPTVLHPGEPGSLELIEGLYGQLLPNFRSPRLNVGCDETFELGQGRSRAACDERGVGRVYLDFLLRVLDRARAHGRTPMFWGDIVLKHPERIGELPGDVVALNWGYEADHPFAEECPKFQRAGIPFYVCPSTCTFRAITGRADVAVDNLRNATEHGRRCGAEGCLITIWGDSGHWQPEAAEAIGLTYGAAISWCARANRDRDAATLAGGFWFGDPTGEAGRGVWELGTVHRHFDPGAAPNLLTWVLARHGGDEPVRDRKLIQSWRELGPTSDRQMADAREQLDSAERRLAAAPMRRDPERTRRECGVAARMSRHALDNLSARIAQGAQHDRELDRKTRRRLGADLQAILADYRACWLSRSRPGGLDDSARPLDRRVAAYLEDI